MRVSARPEEPFRQPEEEVSSAKIAAQPMILAD
jgi:hypothetical protein